jgi:hypothetical protein
MTSFDYFKSIGICELRFDIVIPESYLRQAQKAVCYGQLVDSVSQHSIVCGYFVQEFQEGLFGFNLFVD